MSVTQFWGCSIKSDKPHNETIEPGVFVSVTQAVLVKGKDGAPTYVYCQPEGGEKVAIAVLRPPATDVSRIELSFGSHDSPLKFFIEGSGEVHLSGFESPERGMDSDIDSEDEMYRSLADESDEEGEEDEEQADDAVAKAVALSKQMKAGKNGGQPQVVLGESDESEDGEEGEEGESGESSEEDKAKVGQKPKQQQQQKKPNQPAQKKQEEKKTENAPQKRANDTPNTQQQKKQKTDDKTSTPVQKGKPATPASTPGTLVCKTCNKNFNNDRAMQQHQLSTKHV